MVLTSLSPSILKFYCVQLTLVFMCYLDATLVKKKKHAFVSHHDLIPQASHRITSHHMITLILSHFCISCISFYSLACKITTFLRSASLLPNQVKAGERASIHPEL